MKVQQSKNLVNKLFQLAVVSQKGSLPGTTQKTQKVMGKILVSGKPLNLGVRGPGEKPPWGRQDRVVPGVATLDRSPDQSPVVRPISPTGNLREIGALPG